MPVPLSEEAMLESLTRIEALLQDLSRHTHAPTYASILIQEFFSNQDLDGGAGAGTSIYGHPGGFRLDPRDPEVPPALQAAHHHPRFFRSVPVLTWQEYLATLQPPAV